MRGLGFREWGSGFFFMEGLEGSRAWGLTYMGIACFRRACVICSSGVISRVCV